MAQAADWQDLFNGKDEYEGLIGKIEAVATEWFERDGKLVMTKPGVCIGVCDDSPGRIF